MSALPDLMHLTGQLDYDPAKVGSKLVMKVNNARIYLMALCKNQSIPAHTVSDNAFLMALEGEAILTIGKNLYDLIPGVAIELPGGEPHAIKALSNFKMVIIR